MEVCITSSFIHGNNGKLRAKFLSSETLETHKHKIDNLCKIVDYRLGIKDRDGLKHKRSGMLSGKGDLEPDRRVFGVHHRPTQEPADY